MSKSETLEELRRRIEREDCDAIRQPLRDALSAMTVRAELAERVAEERAKAVEATLATAKAEFGRMWREAAAEHNATYARMTGEIVAAETERDEARVMAQQLAEQGRIERAAKDALRARAARLEASLPDDIRAKGWMVAVHNDYRLKGEQHTFWLFTRDGRAVKGEGPNDIEALCRVRSALTDDAKEDGHG